MRTIVTLIALALSLSATASAQVRFLPYVGYGFGAGYDISEEALEEASEDPNAETEFAGGFIVGVGAEVALTPAVLPIALKVRPSVETVFLSGAELEEETDIEGEEFITRLSLSQSRLQVNLDAIGEFAPPLAPVAPYAGVGLAYATYSLEAEAEVEFDGDTESDSEEVDDSAFGLNLLGGVRFGSGFIAPFVQARYTLLTLRPGEEEIEEAGEEFDEDDEISGGLAVQAGVSIGL